MIFATLKTAAVALVSCAAISATGSTVRNVLIENYIGAMISTFTLLFLLAGLVAIINDRRRPKPPTSI